MIEHNEFDTKRELEEKRKNIKTLDDLFGFIEDVKNNYNIGYGDAPRAIAQAALATAWYLSGEFGITNFQAGFTMWDFIRDWNFSGNKCGLKIVDYDKMLYPQYDNHFEKSISKEVWVNLQEQTKKNLEGECDFVSGRVIKHWQSIANGNVPFGYKIRED